MFIYEIIPCQLVGYNTRYNNSGRLGEFIVYVAFSHVYFRHQKFSFHADACGTKNRRRKMESIYGAAGFWSVCHGYETVMSRGGLVQ